jgi:hypothetical protein
VGRGGVSKWLRHGPDIAGDCSDTRPGSRKVRCVGSGLKVCRVEGGEF